VKCSYWADNIKNNR